DMVKLQPGEVMPRLRSIKGNGVMVAWFDSIGSEANWEDARASALSEFRKGRTLRLLEAKRVELDSLMSAGWSVDSVAALWGGFEHLEDVTPEQGIPGVGGVARVDSLVFGGAHPPALATGATSGWVLLDRGMARIRVKKRILPSPDQITARAESRRRMAIERGLQQYFGRLSATYPVRILDPALDEVALPPLPADTP
ncbi:MAG: hypothetical protein ACREFI_13800, partial [Stellaceae bacterium]